LDDQSKEHSFELPEAGNTRNEEGSLRNRSSKTDELPSFE
jgi:hypothetical protein